MEVLSFSISGLSLFVTIEFEDTLVQLFACLITLCFYGTVTNLKTKALCN